MYWTLYGRIGSRWKTAIAVSLTISIFVLLSYNSHPMALKTITIMNSTNSTYSLDKHLQTHASLSATTTSFPSPGTPSDLPLGLYDMLRHHIHSITAENFTSRTGKFYSLPKTPRFTQPLGKNVLILDVESRDLDGAGGLLDENMPVTDKLQDLTLGRLNHYLFAMLHGYDYQLVQFPENPDLHGTWHKVPAMRDAIKEYEYVVFMDGDAIFTHPHLPLEWLLNYWGVSNDTTMALAEDPDGPYFYNLKKLNINLNTGFVIAHQTARSEEFFDAWWTCPDETRYKGCAHWKLIHTHEQGVVNEYLRYDYPEEIQILPCTEANGHPGSGDCEGEFVSHYWSDKSMIASGVKEAMAQYFWPSLQKAYSHNRSDLVSQSKRPSGQ